MITDQRQIFNWLKANFSGFDSYLVMKESSETNWKTLKSRNFTYFVMRVRDDYIADRKEYLKSIGAKRIKFDDKYAKAWYDDHGQRWYSDIRFEIPKLKIS